ncbi:hypothetical protein BC831DRAFT_448594 [Entophlyctis helioformis]|nr:hypothetical protein BC831DRAFT_448594 [Entophlyctis helioformis]
MSAASLPMHGRRLATASSSAASAARRLCMSDVAQAASKPFLTASSAANKTAAACFRSGMLSTSRSGAMMQTRTAAQTRGFHASARALLKKDPYDTLGVGRTSTANEIKKAYYQLAKQFHPDTNKDPSAKEKFVEIQEAYEVLSDEQKRAQFDQYGQSAFNGDSGGAGGFHAGGFPGGGFGGFGGGRSGGFPNDIFDQLFNGFRDRGAQNAGEDLTASMNISFMEAVKGTKKPLTFVSVRKCQPCSGSGVKTGHNPKSCHVCNGSGQVVFTRGGFAMATTCNACGGAGKIIPPGAKCTTCSGAGRVRERQSIVVDVPPGVDDGMRVRLQGQGDVPLDGDGPSGDLFVQLNVANHAIFKRDGADILVNAPIPLNVAILGGTVRVETVDGPVDVTIPPGTQPNERKVLRKRGAAKLSQQRRGEPDRGDQWITLQVTVPKTLTARQKQLLEEAFGPTSTASSSTSSSSSRSASSSDTRSKSTGSNPSSSSSSTAAASDASDAAAEAEDKSKGHGFMGFFKDLAKKASAAQQEACGTDATADSKKDAKRDPKKDADKPNKE